MATEVYLVTGLLVILVAYLALRVHQMMKFQGRMLVTCPENRKPAAVRIAWMRALRAAVLGKKQLQLCACSRWPEMDKCEQDCLFQVERDPEGHKVWNVAANYFAGKACVCCGKPIEALSHIDDYPALIDKQMKSREWDKLRPEDLPEAFENCKPICSSCHAIETLIREQPDRVTYRPWERSGPLGEYKPEGENKPKNIETRM